MLKRATGVAGSVTWDGVLVRFGEIGIKSPPVRRQMERRLQANLEDALLRRRVEGHVARIGPRLWLTGGGDGGAEALAALAARTFGIVSVSPAIVTAADLDVIGAIAAKLALERPWTRFAIRASRAGQHAFSSNDMGIHIGSSVYRAAEAVGRTPVVDLDTPELEILVEVRNDKAYISLEKIAGPGGLPMGAQGRVVALISDRASAVAAWMMMRRGATVVPVHVGHMGSAPLELLEPLWGWGLPEEVRLLPACSGSVSKQILLDTAARIADECKADAIVTGDVLGSQLIETGLPVMRPTHGLDPETLDQFAARIGLPDEVIQSILDESSDETVDSLLSMRRMVGP